MNRTDLNTILMEIGVLGYKEVDENSNDIENSYDFADFSGRKMKIITDELSEDDMKIAIMAKQTKYLKTIKNILMFFVITYAIFFIKFLDFLF